MLGGGVSAQCPCPLYARTSLSIAILQSRDYTARMSYSLLEFDDYDNAPTEPHRKFAVLEQKARRRMNELLDQAQSNELVVELRNQYTTLMISAARALGVPGVTHPPGMYKNDWEEYQAFSTMVQGAIAHIMLNEEAIAKPYSVQLASSTKAKIDGQITILRSLVENSDMQNQRRQRLLEQLDRFSSELNRTRLNYAEVAAVATIFLASMAGVTSTLADAPNAYKTVGSILKWIGQDKSAEEQERERLGVPIPILLPPAPAPSPTNSSRQSSFGGFADDLDDDVPF